ncbi:MAG: hypothetical protein FWF59_09065 [Turicibacter sp.]|nr:hypothetical protein [Turicibacter sp.]
MIKKMPQIIYQSAIVISGVTATILFFAARSRFVVPTLVASLLLLILFTRSQLYKDIFHEIKEMGILGSMAVLVISGTVTASMLAHFPYSQGILLLTGNLAIPSGILRPVLMLGAIPFIFFYLTYFYRLMLKPAALLVLGQHKLNGWVIGIAAGIILTLIAFLFFLNYHTPVFFSPRQATMALGDAYHGFLTDVIFQTDTDPIFSHYNVFMRDVPSPRQPLFSLFSFPLVAPLYGLGNLFPWIPNLYPTLVMGLQYILGFLSGLMIYHMVKKELQHPRLFLVFYLTTYTMVIFPLILERFLFGLFYLIMLVYLHYFNKGKDMAWLGAVGTNVISLLMAGVLFDWGSKQSWKSHVIHSLKRVQMLLALMVFFGRLGIFFYDGAVYDSARWLMPDVSFSNQLMQFSEFVYGSIVFPETVIGIRGIPRYEQRIVTEFNILGLLFILMSIWSVIKNPASFFVRICAFWLLVSFILFGILGWAVDQHNLLLFSPLFSFSYTYLIFLFFQQLLSRVKWSGPVLAALIFGLAAYNLAGLFDLLEFAITYYPSGG